MASVSTFTKSGTKATTAAKLDAKVFGVDVKNHELLKQAYQAYQANGRENLAVTKTRGEVSGGGKKPWRQKGTGRARFGSSRVPIWRGGGITFGPTGNENYSKSVNKKASRKAIRQALTLASNAGKVIVVEAFGSKDGKAAPAAKLLTKIGAVKNTLLVVDNKDEQVERATRNLANVKSIQANYLNVYDVLNADHVVISQKSLGLISEWLAEPTTKATAPKEVKL